MKRMMVKLLISLLSIVLVTTCIIGNSKTETMQFTDEIMAYIGKEPLHLEEFKQILNNEELANTYHYFGEKYGAQDSIDFFDKSYNQENPLEWIKKNTLEKCIAIKVEQIMAKEQGIWEDISYYSFLKAFQAENNRRKQAVEVGEMIYGPIEYPPYEYYVYMLANKREELIDSLINHEIKVDEKKLLNHYNETKERYQLEDQVTIEMLYKQVNPTNIQGIAEDINNMKEQLGKGESLEALQKRWKTKEESPIYMTYVFKPENSRQDGKLYEGIKTKIHRMSIGDISGLEKNGNQLLFYKILEREEMGYISFEEAKVAVKNDYIAKAYEALMKQRIEKSKVLINEDLYNQFYIER